MSLMSFARNVKNGSTAFDKLTPAKKLGIVLATPLLYVALAGNTGCDSTPAGTSPDDTYTTAPTTQEAPAQTSNDAVQFYTNSDGVRVQIPAAGVDAGVEKTELGKKLTNGGGQFIGGDFLPQP